MSAPPSPVKDPSYDTFMCELLKEFPRFSVVYKRHSRLSHVIDLLLRLVTLSRMRTFMTHYHTVIGETLYVPDAWDYMSPVDRVILLRHERVHLRQKRRMTFVGLAFVYLIPWFPIGLAYGRARLEWEAYAETLRATCELLGFEAASSPHLRRHIVARFCGPDYGWMWPFARQVHRWYDAVLETLPDAPRHERASPVPVTHPTNLPPPVT